MLNRLSAAGWLLILIACEASLSAQAPVPPDVETPVRPRIYVPVKDLDKSFSRPG